MSDEPDWLAMISEPGDDRATREQNKSVALLASAAYATGKRHAIEWRPIADAPRDGTPVLLYVDGQQTEAFYVPLEVSLDWEGADSSTGAVWSCADDEWQIEVEEYHNEDGSITYNDGPAKHYMPLPPAPETKE